MGNKVKLRPKKDIEPKKDQKPVTVEKALWLIFRETVVTNPERAIASMGINGILREFQIWLQNQGYIIIKKEGK